MSKKIKNVLLFLLCTTIIKKLFLIFYFVVYNLKNVTFKQYTYIKKYIYIKQNNSFLPYTVFKCLIYKIMIVIALQRLVEALVFANHGKHVTA